MVGRRGDIVYGDRHWLTHTRSGMIWYARVGDRSQEDTPIRLGNVLEGKRAARPSCGGGRQDEIHRSLTGLVSIQRYG